MVGFVQQPPWKEQRGRGAEIFEEQHMADRHQFGDRRGSVSSLSLTGSTETFAVGVSVMVAGPWLGGLRGDR
jgi:hypothetical protein